MHNTGRQMVMVFLRAIILALVCGAGVGCAFLAWYLGGRYEMNEHLRTGLAVGTGATFFIAVLGVLLAFGGWALHRFDVSRAT